MNKFTLFSKAFNDGSLWIKEMKTYEERKTPTYEMQQRDLNKPSAIFDLTELQLQPAVVRG